MGYIILILILLVPTSFFVGKKIGISIGAGIAFKASKKKMKELTDGIIKMYEKEIS